MKGVIKSQGLFSLVDIFGYCSRGVPGIEIVGVGALGKCLKEKFIYLSRQERIKLPPLKYVLCIENNEGLIDKDNFDSLEFPMLILFWALGGVLQIGSLENCVAHGKVSLGKKVWHLPLDRENVFSLGQKCKYTSNPGVRWIMSKNLSDKYLMQNHVLLEAEDLFSKFCDWSFDEFGLHPLTFDKISSSNG